MESGSNILEILRSRDKYVGHLEEDIVKHDLLLEECSKEKKKLEDLIESIESLGTYPEKESLIPLAKNIYMKGNIVHTGEFYVKHTAFPDSYIVLKTRDQTLQSLKTRVNTKESEITKIENARLQLEERLKIFKGEKNPDVSEDDLPEEIRSEKGSAVKVGEFYEILEFEDQ